MSLRESNEEVGIQEFEVRWYRKYGRFVLRIAKSSRGEEYIIGDSGWNSNHPDETIEPAMNAAWRENFRLAPVQKKLTTNEEYVLKERKSRTLREIGVSLNLTRERIRQIEAKARRKLSEFPEENVEMTALKDFKYQNLTTHQLASVVYELNAALVDAIRSPRQFEELREKAQKIINRARLEGIL